MTLCGGRAAMQARVICKARLSDESGPKLQEALEGVPRVSVEHEGRVVSETLIYALPVDLFKQPYILPLSPFS